MNMYISLKDLGFLILFLSGVTVLVILAIVLVKVNNLISKLTSIVDTNRINIDKTLDQLPGTVANVNAAVNDVRNTAITATSFVEGIGETVSETAASVEDSYGEFMDILKNLINIVVKIKELFK